MSAAGWPGCYTTDGKNIGFVLRVCKSGQLYMIWQTNTLAHVLQDPDAIRPTTRRSSEPKKAQPRRRRLGSRIG